MRPLGFAGFALVRHDLGGRVAHRMARDHPEAVGRIAVLDIALPATLSARPYNDADRGAAVGDRSALPLAPTEGMGSAGGLWCRTCGAGRHRLIYVEKYSHNVFYGTWTLLVG